MEQVPYGREPRFSDDRHWYWTGTAWVPAAQAPPALAPQMGVSQPIDAAPIAAQPSAGTGGGYSGYVGQLSPDRMWRWDGRAWQPVFAPMPMAPPATRGMTFPDVRGMQWWEVVLMVPPVVLMVAGGVAGAVIGIVAVFVDFFVVRSGMSVGARASIMVGVLVTGA